MISGLSQALDRCAGRPLLVSGAGDRAYCAGGDIKMQAQAIRAGDLAGPARYFRDEYGLNAKIHNHATPYVAFLNGITMGGGYGVSGHGSHVIATEKTVFAMPEVGIGFFPDIGAAWKLARVPHQMGTYMAVTGNSVGPADMIHMGLAHAYISSGKLDALKTGLETAGPDRVIADLREDVPGESVLAKNEGVIAACFAHDSVEAILDALLREGSDFALQTAQVIETRSPTSLKIALAHIRQAESDTFADVIARDLRLALKFLETPDFPEGVRAAVIDKDRQPRWNPPSLGGVDAAMVALYLGPAGD